MTEIFSMIDFDAYKYRSGEYPYISVMNRPLERLRVADMQLDNAVQFLARSLRLQTTSDTKALMHFDGSSFDCVGENEAVQVGSDSELFSFDGFMKGAAFVQPAAINLLSYVNGLNPAMTSLNGWTLTGVLGQKADVRVDSSGLTVSNLNGIDVPAGSIEVVSGEFSTAPGHPLAFSIDFETPNNLTADGVSVEVGLRFSESSGGEVTVTRSFTVAPIVWRGRLQFENSDVPSGGSFAKAFVRINYSEDSKASVRVKDFMVEDSKIAHLFTLATKAATRLSYPKLIDLTSGRVSVFGWMRLSTAYLAEHMSPICPVSISSQDGTVFIQGEHTHDDAGNIIFNLVQTNGVIRQTTSDDIDLSAENKDTYLPFILRVDTALAVAEFAIIDRAYAVHKASIPLPDPLPSGKWDLIVGKGDDRTEEFSGPVAELRYDTAWVNDFEMMLVALSRRPFSTGVEDDGGDVLPEYGVNLIENPCGKFGNFFWSGFPANFQAVVEDRLIGSGFVWSGSASADTEVRSELIPIANGQNFHLRAYMGSAAGTTGEHGVSVTFYASNGTTQVGSKLTLPATPASNATKYELSSSGIAGAEFMRVGMYAANGFQSSKAFWTRFKLEYGEESQFSDDSSPALATYAP